MNLNDLRANAYKKLSQNKEDKSEEDMFISDVRKVEGSKKQHKIFEKVNTEVNNIFSTDKKSVKSFVQKSNDKNFILPTQQKNEIADLQLDRATELLKKGGLVKVPVEESGDSVYRRVAKFLLLIGVDEAAKVMKHLTDEQTEKIVPEIASIRSVDAAEASEILSEFQGLLKQARSSGGLDTAREILSKAYGSERAEELLEKAAPESDGKPFEYLNDAASDRVFILLKDESPAIQALVLSRILPEKAASVISKMDNEMKRSVISRLAKMEAISPDVIRRTDKALHEKLFLISVDNTEAIDGKNALAEILRKMSPSSEDEILESISYDDPDLGNDLRNRLFTIQDIENSDDRFIQEILRSMTEKDIAFLIADKEKSFRDKILFNVSKGRCDSILEEEEINKPMLRRDCNEITEKFLRIMRTAYENGKFKVFGRDDNEYVE